MKKTYVLERPSRKDCYFVLEHPSLEYMTWLCDYGLRNLWEVPKTAMKIWMTVSRTDFPGSVKVYFHRRHLDRLYASHVRGEGESVLVHPSTAYVSSLVSGELRKSFPVAVGAEMRLWIKLEYKV